MLFRSIDLNKPQDSLISLYIEGQPWFNGQLGVHNKNVAVKIEDRLIEPNKLPEEAEEGVAV